MEPEIVVYVRQWDAGRKKCQSLGHQFYRCGNCKKTLLKVFSESKYDSRCPHCDWEVVVLRERRG